MVDPHLVYLLGAIAGLCAILGHMFTPLAGIQRWQRSGDGVGAFAAIAPRAILISLALFVVVVAITRYVSLGSILGAAVFPIAVYWLDAGHARPSLSLL